MTIHKKILLLLLLSVSLYTVLGVSFQRYLILPDFEALETEEARKNMDRCLEALHREVHHLDMFCFDWAAWDDTFEFMAEPTEAYKTSNLSPASFIDNDINFIYFFDRRGNLVWGRYYDLETEEPEDFPDFQQGLMAATHPLLNPGPRDESHQGLINTSKGVMLFACRSILPSEEVVGEENRGTMIMARLLNDEILNEIQEQVQVALEVFPADSKMLPPEAMNLDLNEERIDDDDQNTLTVSTLVPDFFNEPALYFIIRGPREIMARGVEAVRLQTLVAVATGLLFTLLLAASMGSLVSRPLHMLSEQAQKFHLGSGPIPHWTIRRNDEIGRLAKDFNNMMRRVRDEEIERRTTETALRNSEARLDTILKTAPDAIVVTNAKGYIESANDAAAKLFGYDIDGLTGLTGRHFLAEEEQTFWIEATANYAANPGAEPFTANRESAIRNREGLIHPVHISVTSMLLEGEVYFTSAIRDISEMQEMQESMARARHLATVGEMGASVAHEIRNPLAGMRGAIELLQGNGLDEAEEKIALDGLAESVDRIAHTVDQLLSYAKPISPRSCTFLIRPLIEAVVDKSINSSGGSITIDCPEDTSINADPALFRQVLENIWSNAVQAAGPSGTFNWAVALQDGSTKIILSDNGPGIEQSSRERLFEPFFTTRVNGTGLGLSISHRIIEAHHGTIYLDDGDPVGVCVVILLSEGV